MNRRLANAVRQFADQQSDRLAQTPTQMLIATVTSTSPLKVSWRGSTLTVNGRHASYTPGVGDRVTCKLIDGQLIVENRIV